MESHTREPLTILAFPVYIVRTHPEATVPQEQDEFRKGLAFAARVGTELVVATMVGVFLGYLLDRYLGTRPWLMVVGLVIGAIAGFLNVYRFVQRMSQ